MRGMYQLLQKLACGLSDLTIFQNPDDFLEFRARGVVSSSRSRVILGAGVDTGQLSPDTISPLDLERVRRELGLGPGQAMVTMVSRQLRSKGVLDFAAAAQIVARRHPGARFVYCGLPDIESPDRLTPAEMDRLKEMVICLAGREDIPALLALSRLFVLPTYYREGVPRAMLEAASMGLPIITTDSPGCRQVVENGVNGLLVPARNPEALARAIGRLLADEDLGRGWGRESRQRAIRLFDISLVAGQIRAAYGQLLSRKGLEAGACGRRR